MRSTFAGLELARRALATQQTALNTTGHNIANANTPGYTRQIPNLVTTTPDKIVSLGRQISVGTGVDVRSIERARDVFVDRQYRYEMSGQQYWEARESTLEKIEGLLNEPSEFSLSEDMTAFWTAWSKLATNPENLGARAVVLERAATLCDTFHHIDQQITELQNSLDHKIRVQVEQINSYAQQIRDLNNQIKRAEVAGDNPNDLKDERDRLVDELSKIVSVRVEESKDPTFTDRDVGIFKLYIGDESKNQILVNDATFNELKAEIDDTDDYVSVKWATGSESGKILELGNQLGSLKANIEMRGYKKTSDSKENNYLGYLRSKFDELAKGIAEAVNAIHKMGTNKVDKKDKSDLPFFVNDINTGDDANITAANINVNTVLKENPWKVVTGSMGYDSTTDITNYGDGKAATAIASLSNGWKGYLEFTSETEGPIEANSFIDYYGSSIAELGVDVQQSIRMRSGQDVLVNHMGNQRDAISGVSLDEEMTNLIKFQKSYSAAARIVTMIDTMLDTIVNGMGITR